MADRYIFKVLTPTEWEGFQSAGVFKGSPVDLADGYIHMSCQPELKETLDKWYADQAQVYLLAVDSHVVQDDLKYEVSRGGAEFPHLFADLPLSAVGQVWQVSAEQGRYTLPMDLKAN